MFPDGIPLLPNQLPDIPIEYIVAGVPIWAWILPFVLVAAGYPTLKDRESAIWVAALPSLLVGFSMQTVFLFDATIWPWLSFAVGMVLFGFIGYRLQNHYTLKHMGDRVELRGEWFTLTLMLFLYCVNFVIGVIAGTMPIFTQVGLFPVLAPAMIGAGSGILIGRSLNVLSPLMGRWLDQ